MKKLAVLALLYVLLLNLALAQPYKLRLSGDVHEAMRWGLKSSYGDSVSLTKALSSALRQGHNKGYLLNSIDSIAWSGNTVSASWYAGPRFYWANIEADSIAQYWLDKAKLRPNSLRRGAIAVSEAQRLQDRLLRRLLNQGYPFAKVSLQPTQWQGEYMHARIQVTPGDYIVFDSLHFDSLEVKTLFLESYLGVQEGRAYSHENVQRISNRLRQLPFLQQAGPTQVGFQWGVAQLRLPLAYRPSNEISALLGAQFGGARPIITGQAQVQLENLFGSGKKVDLYFRRLKAASQQFSLQYEHPSFLRLPIHLQGAFFYQQEDSLFANIRQKIGIGYDVPNGLRIYGVFTLADARTGAAVSANPAAFPELSSTSTVLYGGEARWQRLDDPISPRSGWQLLAGINAGVQTLRPLLASTHPDYEALYGKSSLKQPQAQGWLLWQKYWPLGQKGALGLQGNWGQMWGKRLFRNELFRVGGLKSLRGFDEGRFFTPAYYMAQTEYRQYFGVGAYAMLFADGGYLEGDGIWVMGFGAGMAFQTKAGLFRLLYALGKEPGQAVSTKTAKVHFGLSSGF